MQTLFALIGLSISLSTPQLGACEQKGFLIKTEFEYHGKNKTSKSMSAFILDADNKAWTTLTEPKDEIALLGRVTSSNSKSLQMEYIVVDTKQNNAVISSPGIHAVLGETTQIEVGQANGEKVLVNLLAAPTEYTNKD